jgi:hypothetical protein
MYEWPQIRRRRIGVDLCRLTRTADIESDADGLRWMSAASAPTGDLQVPVLATHTLVDVLTPVEHQEEYAETIRDAGRSALLRQADVDAVGHCAFTVAEDFAATDAAAGSTVKCALQPGRVCQRPHLGSREVMAAVVPIGCGLASGQSDSQHCDELYTSRLTG